MMKTRYILAALLLALALTACRSRSEPTTKPKEDSTPTPAYATPGQSPLPKPQTSPLSPSTDSVKAAAAYLADELSTSPEQVTVVSYESVEWPDASLGCPKPGTAYAQVVTPGYKLILEVEGKRYEVHTNSTGQSVVICETPADPSDPDGAFKILLRHLTRSYPGLGLDQREDWTKQDITKESLVGSTTLVWRSGEWTLEMKFNVVPQPDYESRLLHQKAGPVWLGTLTSNGEVNPAYAPLQLSFKVGACDESIPQDTLDEWAKVDITVQDEIIHIEQNLAYVCCAYPALAAGRDGDVIKIIETNTGEVCRCTCGYPVEANLAGLEAGTYNVEIWGIQYYDTHSLELLGSAEMSIP